GFLLAEPAPDPPPQYRRAAMYSFDDYLMRFLDDPLHVVGAAVGLALLVGAFVYRDGILFPLKFIAKSLARNPLRSGLAGLATFVLVLVVTLVWTVLYFLDMV